MIPTGCLEEPLNDGVPSIHNSPPPMYSAQIAHATMVRSTISPRLPAEIYGVMLGVGLAGYVTFVPFALELLPTIGTLMLNGLHTSWNRVVKVNMLALGSVHSLSAHRDIFERMPVWRSQWQTWSADVQLTEAIAAGSQDFCVVSVDCAVDG